MESPSADLHATRPARSRSRYALAIVLVIAVGMGSRRFPWLLPAALGKYPGDVLWSLMVFLGWGFLLPRCATRGVLILTLATGLGVEFLKLYHAPALDAFRPTTLGHLLLGHSFSWLNLVAYALGGLLGALGEEIGRRVGASRKAKATPPSGAEPDRSDRAHR